MTQRPMPTNSGKSITLLQNHEKAKEIAATYIRENFERSDRIAIVLLSKRNGGVLQRIGTAERFASLEFQGWLRHMNAQKYDVYVSMNTLRPEAQRRTNEDIDQIRHVFLDFDEDGTAAVEALLQREELPEPNYLLNSSPDKWQVVWKIQNCDKEQAERIERALVRETGADQAVIDIARVLRLPGFYNHKYPRPHMIRVESRSKEITTPDQFPQMETEARTARSPETKVHFGKITQSERDWAYVRDQLRQGTEPEQLIQELKLRRSHKFNPEDYAHRTVRKAVDSLRREGSQER